MKIRGSFFIVISMIVVLGIAGCGIKKAGGRSPGKTGPSGGEQQTAVAVTTEPVVLTTMKNVITLNGKVKPVREAVISPKISGKVSQIHFELGQKVNQGAVLLKLDDSNLRLDLQSAEASLKVTRNTLDSSLLSAEVNYNDVKRNYQRSKRLYENGIASKQEYEDAESQFKLAEDTYNAAKTAEQSGETKARATLEQAKIQYEIIKMQLMDSVVRAPISGIIATKDVSVGKYIGNGTIVASVVDLSSVIVETNVTEAMVNRIKVGDKVEISVKAALNQSLTGEIMAIAPAVDSASINYPVKIKIANFHHTLKSGMFAEIKLTLDQAEQVLASPLAAVGDDSGQKFVFVLDGDKVTKKMIKTGLSDGRLVQVTEGLTEKDLVIVKGLDQVKEGTKVTLGK